VKPFRSPEKWLGELDSQAIAKLITATSDVALIVAVDEEGLINDVAFGSDELSLEVEANWIGRPWADTVTVESRSKIEGLLRDARNDAVPRWRHVNHPSAARGVDLPVMYTAVRAGDEGQLIAVGRSLRSLATLQQRLVDAQQSVERDYLRLRHLETRYRLLFQMTTEAVLIVDAATRKVVDANPPAARLLGDNGRRLVGRPFPDGLDVPSTQRVQSLLAGVRSAGRSDEVRARLADGSRDFLVSASLFREEQNSFFLVRLSAVHSESSPTSIPADKSRTLEIIEQLPEAFVLTDLSGHIQYANRSFLDLAQLATEEQARGELLERWLGRGGVDFNVLLAHLREHGAMRMFATTMQGEYGSSADVEICAVSIPDADEVCLGFTIRDVGARPASDSRIVRDLPRSVEQLTELVGRVPLKELVRDTTDMIERLCIEAALELTGDNRASAAEMLGLSRQSLYVKLRRYGLGELVSADSDES
jgi:transcriptional regulator PpsR